MVSSNEISDGEVSTDLFFFYAKVVILTKVTKCRYLFLKFLDLVTIGTYFRRQKNMTDTQRQIYLFIRATVSKMFVYILVSMAKNSILPPTGSFQFYKSAGRKVVRKTQAENQFTTLND